MNDIETLKSISRAYSIQRYMNTDITPKAKALEIVTDYTMMLKGTTGSASIIKSCAIRVTEELISVTGSKYWYDVKSEIEKLSVK